MPPKAASPDTSMREHGSISPSEQSAWGRRVVLLCDWLPPDFGAVGQYAMLRAQALAAGGHSVALYGLTSGETGSTQTMAGTGELAVHRIRSRPVPKGSLAGRLLWTVGTNLRLIYRSWRDLRRADSVLFTGAPPFMVHALVPLKPWLRGRLVYRITDFHPECLIAAMRRAPAPLRWFRSLTIYLRRFVDRFEVLGEDQRRRLHEIGIVDARIELVRDASPVEFVGRLQPLALPASLRGHIALLYSGNLGVAHDVATFLAAYQYHHSSGTGRVRLWLNATGTNAQILAKELGRRSLPYHHSSPVPLEVLPQLLTTPHAHLITLRDEFVGYVLPSKIYACLDSGKPILFIGSARSDVDLLARKHYGGGRYLRFDVGDPVGVADGLEKLADILTL